MTDNIRVTAVYYKHSKGSYHVWLEYRGRPRTRVSIQSDKREAEDLVRRLKLAHGLIRSTDKSSIGAIVGSQTLQ